MSTREQQERRSEIIDLAQAGYAPSEIRDLIGGDRNAISKVLQRARRDGVDIPKFPSGQVATVPRLKYRTVAVREDVLEAFRPAARERSLTTTVLVNRIVGVIAEFPVLIDNILDDQDAEA